MHSAAKRAPAALFVVGSLGLMGVAFWLTMRWSLFGLLVVGVPVLLWTWIRRPDLLKRRGAAFCVLALVVAAAPADIRLGRRGRPSVSVKPILWGLPTRETMERIDPESVVWGGCIMPINPARYAVLVSW